MTIHKFDIFLANLNPQRGAEPGKIRPVVILQNDILNSSGHATTIVSPMTTKVYREAHLLRLHINTKEAGIDEPSDIMVDHIRTVDNKRLIKKLGCLTDRQKKQLLEKISILMM